jgi:hypothetical protein
VETVTEIHTDRVIVMSRRDYEVLTVVARMYLDAVNDDPDLEHVSGTQALVLTEIRDAVQRADEYFAKSPETPDTGFR